MKKFALFVLVYTLAVILFGAYVRISGSGAGCGEHWPSCEGEVMPSDLFKNHAKTIEFTHRTTSGLSGVFVVILAIGAYVAKASPAAKRWALISLILIVSEGLLGASLVLFKWVGLDASRGRAIMMPLHLGNTYLLLTALAQAMRAFYNPNAVYGFVGNRAVKIGAALLFVTGMFGALAALGDTLFPGTRGLVTEGHTYLKLRNIHPFLAVLTIGHILSVAVRRRDDFRLKIFGRYAICDVILFLTALQGIIGVMNIFLSAPAYMQIIHLLGSDILWVFYGFWLIEEK
ncbi:MAG: COX15/CtaA family protein [Spirochaetes bacterium]|nr:COX15/CtaA family protein [Spirochaetota bacterium]MBX3723558.1 COX15/CtaA family protein [Turneriella sp.]